MAESLAAPQMSDGEKITTAESFKAEGNEFFKTKNYKKAIGKYHRAILYLKGVGQSRNVGALIGLPDPQPRETFTTEKKQIFDKLKIDCFNNLAACLLQQESPSYEKVLEYCQEVLKVTSNNIKAQHRRGVALYHLHKYDDAMESLLMADKKDAATRRYIGLCKQALEKQELGLRATYKAMFSGGGSEKKSDRNAQTNDSVDKSQASASTDSNGIPNEKAEKT